MIAHPLQPGSPVCYGRYMEGDDRGTLAMVREALVEALALDVMPTQIAAEQPLYEHPIAMDSLGFYRVIVELEVRR
ncbi:MAG: hypothetical protein QF464_18285, partial [Myxococcota bacterium]|nr:hypothetical protein [Myxococcota bacterium]